MSDELEQSAQLQNSAQVDDVDGGSQHDTGDEGNLALNHLDEDSQEQPDQEEEDEEVEIGERKFALPKSAAEKLKAERLMQADYTQKTQGVAEDRKQIATEREQFQKHQQDVQQHLDDIADLRAIDKEIKRIDAMNLADYVESDPVGVMKVQEQRRQLENQRQELAGNITQKQQNTALEEQQSIAKQIQDAEGYFTREIKGWSKERNNALQQYAASNGIDVKVLGQALLKNPAIIKLVHNAELYDQLVKKQSPKSVPAPAAKPAIKIGSSGASAVTDPAKMTDTQFAAWRRNQIKNRK